MRENRLAKLAGLKKMASHILDVILRGWMAKVEGVRTTEELERLRTSYLNGEENSNLLIEDNEYNQRFQTALGEKEAALSTGTEKVSNENAKVGTGGLESLNVSLLSKTKDMTQEEKILLDDVSMGIWKDFYEKNKSRMSLDHLNKDKFERNKIYIIPYIKVYLLDTTPAGDFARKLLINLAIIKGDTTSLQLELESSIVEARPKISRKGVPSSKGRSGVQTTRGSSAGATTVELTSPPKTTLIEVGDDKRNYVYTILSPSSFSYTVDGSAPKTVTTSYGKWNTAAQKLNNLEADRKNKAAAATPATPAAAPAAPAATTAETAAPSSNQELEDKITRILLLAQSKPLNMGSLESEMKQITEMSNYLSPKGGLRALSKIIASIVGPNLGQLGAASEAEVAAATPADARVNKGGKFAVDTGIILKQINLLYRQRRGVLDSYFEPATTATPPAATNPASTTPAAAQADDGWNKSASLNKKFIKAATLRRLKIRSQMEAAIDSSAQMGRARVS